jgi:hypothetical protein
MNANSHGPATAKDLRTFGLTLGAACLVWAGIFFWRGKTTASLWLVVIGPLLALLALTVPAALRPLHRVWMPAARAVAQAITWLFLTLAYFLIITPYAIALKLMGKDPLERRIDRKRASYWIARDRTPLDPKSLSRQY